MFIIVVNNTGSKNLANNTKQLIVILQQFKNYKIKVITKQHELNIIPRQKILCFILSGGPILFTEKNCIQDYVININILQQYPNIPVLGICLGFQIMSLCYNGTINRLKTPKLKIIDSIYPIRIHKSIFFKKNNKPSYNVYQHHFDYITSVSKLFTITSRDKNRRIQTIESKSLMRFGVQFHPEMSGNFGFNLIKQFIEFCYKNIILNE